MVKSALDLDLLGGNVKINQVPLYEAHITYDIEHRDIIETDCPKGWKFSAIDGDPVLGKKVFCYLTSYDRYPKVLLSRMRDVVRDMAVDPVRQKIERIVFDTKTGRDNIT